VNDAVDVVKKNLLSNLCIPGTLIVFCSSLQLKYFTLVRF